MSGIKFVVLLVGFVGSCQCSIQAQEVSRKNSGQTETFEARFWSYLLSNNYKNWAPPAGQGGGFIHGKSHHAALQKLYLNRTAAGDPDAFGDESVIILENYIDEKTLESISVMLRSAGSNPLENDWYWITYGPDGTVLQSSARNKSSGSKQTIPQTSFVSTSGSPIVENTCFECHRDAPGDDFVFFNSQRAASRD